MTVEVSKEQLDYIILAAAYSAAARVIQQLLIEKFGVAYSRRYIKRVCRIEHEKNLDK